LAPTVGAAPAGPVFYGDAPDDHHPWAVHDRNRPLPPVITPGWFSSQEQAGKPPSDALILFDGKDLSQWQGSKGGPADWIVRDGYFEVKAGAGEIRTRAKYGDCQLHLEWAAPTKIEGESQGRGNSGVFLMDLLEIQVLDSYNNPTYADGMAGSYYGVNPPLVNPLRPPGEFQVYDIVFRRPIYKEGQALDPGYITVFLNGVLVQDHTPLEGPGGHMGRSRPRRFSEKGPLQLQDHGNPIRFRNIWYRELPPRAVEGGTVGILSTDATKSQRQQTATAIRKDAAQLQAPDQSLARMLRLMESLVYAPDAPTLQTVEQLANQYVAGVKSLPATQLPTKKDEVKRVADAFKYLAKWNALPADFGPRTQLEQLIKDQGWDKKK
jgi:hypothetical protein